MAPGRVFLVESYLPARGERFADDSARVARAAMALRAAGRSVRLAASLYVPGDELSLHVIDAAAAQDAVDAAREAGLAFERVVEALLVQSGPDGRTRAPPPTGARLSR
jgi:hypothetical protein